MKIKFSFDDGKKEDDKLVRLLANYDFENVVFYIPAAGTECANGREITEKEIQYIDNRWEVGGHTFSHQLLTRINPEGARREIEECRKYLMNLLGHAVYSFCYPRGYYNEEIKQMVKDAGFKEARTTEVLRIDEGDDPFEMPTTIHCYQRKEYEGVDWLDVAKEWFQKAKEADGVYHVWGHSKELTKYGDLGKFKKLLDYIDNNK